MQVDIRDDARQVCIWLTKAESADPETDEQIRPLIQNYHDQKYLVAVYRSGTEELFENTLALLKHNRKLVAEREVRADRKPRARSSADAR